MRRFSVVSKLLLGVAVMVAFSNTNARADDMGFAVDPGGNLYSVDLTTATSTLIGYTGIGPFGQTVEGLAISPGGTLYATDDSGMLFSIDSTTAASTFVGPTGLGDVEGLRFDGSTLLATDVSNPTSVYSLNTSTAAPTLITTYAEGRTRGIAVESPTTIVASTDDGSGGSDLTSASLLNGSSTILGALPSFTGSLAFVNGTLYDLDLSGNEYVINPSNGSGTLVGNAGGAYVDLVGANAVGATPEPGTLGLLGTALLAGAGVARRRLRI